MSDKKLEGMVDLASKTPQELTDIFNKRAPWGAIKRVALTPDGEVAFYFDMDNINKTYEGNAVDWDYFHSEKMNVFIQIPKFYTARVFDESTGITHFGIAPEPVETPFATVDDWEVDPAFYRDRSKVFTAEGKEPKEVDYLYISADMAAIMPDGGWRSYPESGGALIHPKETWVSTIEETGFGFSPMDFHVKNMLDRLILTEFGTGDVREVVTDGYYDAATGSTWFRGESTGNYRGLRGIYSNEPFIVEGIRTENGELKISKPGHICNSEETVVPYHKDPVTDITQDLAGGLLPGAGRPAVGAEGLGNLVNLPSTTRAVTQGGYLDRVVVKHKKYYKPAVFADGVPAIPVKEYFEAIGNNIRTLTITPGGEYLIVGGLSGELKVFSTKDWSLVENIAGFSNTTHSLTTTLDGKFFIAGGGSGELKVYSTEDWSLVRNITGFGSGNIQALTPTLSGEYFIAGGGSGELKVYSTEDWSLVKNISGFDATIRALTTTPDGKFLIAGGDSGELKVFSTEDWSLVKNIAGFSGTIYSVIDQPNKGHIAVGGTSGELKIFSTEDWSLVKNIVGFDTGSIQALTPTLSGEYFIAGGNRGGLKVYSTEDWSLVENIAGFSNIIQALTATLDGKHLIAGGNGAELKLFSTKDWSLEDIGALLITSGSLIGIPRFSPDGRFVATGDGGTLYMRDARTLKFLWKGTYGKNTYASREFTEDGKYIMALGGTEYAYAKFNTLTGEVSGPPPKIISSTIRALTTTLDGRHFIAGGHKGKLKVFSTKDWSLVKDITGFTNNIYTLTITPDGKYLIVGGNTGELKVYSTEDWSLVKNISGFSNIIQALTATLSGEFFIAGGGSGELKVYSTKDWSLVKDITGFTNNIYTLTITPDGKYLIVGGNTGELKVFSTKDWSLVKDITGSSSPVYSLTTTLDGEYFIVGSEGGELRAYSVEDWSLFVDFWVSDGRYIIQEGVLMTGSGVWVEGFSTMNKIRGYQEIGRYAYVWHNGIGLCRTPNDSGPGTHIARVLSGDCEVVREYGEDISDFYGVTSDMSRAIIRNKEGEGRVLGLIPTIGDTPIDRIIEETTRLTPANREMLVNMTRSYSDYLPNNIVTGDKMERVRDTHYSDSVPANPFAYYQRTNAGSYVVY